MKICILSSFEDSMQKDTGASVRMYNLAKGLAEAGNDVRVVLPRDKATNELVDGVVVHTFKGLVPRAGLDLLRRVLNIARPTSLYFYDLLFALRVGRVVREVDLVQFEQQPSSGLLIPFIKKVLKKPVVVDCHDVFQALRLQHTNIIRRILETFLEKSAYKNADLILTVSENEKKCLISAGVQGRKIRVVPNGVDTTLFVKLPRNTDAQKKYGLVGYRTVVFVGNLEYLPNLEAIQILSTVLAPRVLAEIKDVKFVVVGRNPDNIRYSKLTFLGFVDEVSEALNASDVAVAPLLHGSGTRLKILEYFSCSLPVVSTSIGAEGLAIEDGVNIFIEDDLDSFALRIIELLNDKKLSTAVGEAARVLVRNTYDWKQITHALEIALACLLSRQLKDDSSHLSKSHG